jgi:2-polyprenyl-6-methoxyphenol hydroxylase-like FAD-dependent oxidoreductase
MPDTKPRTALVIGGGIAGPVTALALHRAGIEATVHEAYPTPAEGVGGTLALAPNGLAALDLIGLREAVEAIGQPMGGTRMSMGGRTVDLPRLTDIAPPRQVFRNDLHRTLHEAATARGIPIEHGKRLERVDEHPDGVTAHFTDGTSARADILVGADGIHSTVRTLIDPAAPEPEYTGILGFETVVDQPVPADPGVIHFTFGKQAYCLYWKTSDGRTRLGMNLPHRTPMSLVEARAIPAEQWLDVLRDTYGNDAPAGDLVRRIDPGQLHATGAIHLMPPVPNWHRGRLVLVGDAVHAPSNSSGQGASLAVESGIDLARCLRDLPTVQEAFTAYEHRRRPRVEKIAAQARKVNRAKAPGPVARAMMPLLMRVFIKIAMNPERNFGPTLRHRIDWDATVNPTRSS